jgi:hypothetical protein
MYYNFFLTETIPILFYISRERERERVRERPKDTEMDRDRQRQTERKRDKIESDRERPDNKNPRQAMMANYYNIIFFFPVLVFDSQLHPKKHNKKKLLKFRFIF